MSAAAEERATTPEELARLRARVQQAADVLFPLWPLDAFTAVNPLGNLSDRSFEEALEVAGPALGIEGYPDSAFFAAALANGRLNEADIAAARARLASDAPQVLQPGAGAGAVNVIATPCELADRRDGGHRTRLVDAEVSRLCAAFLDRGHAGWQMPDRELGLYGCWRQIAAADAGARRLGAGDLRPRARALPARPIEALALQLTELGVGSGELLDLLRRLLGRNPGWASAIRWADERGRGEPSADLVEYLAVMTFYELALVNGQPIEAGPDRPALAPWREDPSAPILLDAYEWHLRDVILHRLEARVVPPRPNRPAAQAVFCIDVRSEGIRRHLERRGDYETLGFAGFFGLAIAHRGLGSADTIAQCPVLVSPSCASTEAPLTGSERRAESWRRRRAGEAAALESFHQVKNDLSSKFVLAELSGWAFGPAALARTLAPGVTGSGRDSRQPPTEPVVDRLNREEAEALAAELEREQLAHLARAHLGPRASALGEETLERLRVFALTGAGEEPDRPRPCSARRWSELLGALPGAGLSPEGHRTRVDDLGAIGLTPEEQGAWAVVALKMMGLTENFARLVLLCGHGSQTPNNPYRGALDCGACGGNQGHPNARVAALLLNRPSVRAALIAAGIDVPEDTYFLAGLHNTATDEVVVLDREQVPLTHRADLIALEADLAAAGRSISEERIAALPGNNEAPRLQRRRGRTAAHRRAADWAEVRPEWGLARNAAFIIGPRSMSEGIDLGCRTFLHSYRAEVDADGSALETILTAPLVVAQWINLQYYFSTVEPDVLGAGDKALHNVVGLRGVQVGGGGDLRLGLPRQSVFDGDVPFHEPVRLLAIVEAPLELISQIVDRNPLLRDMFVGGWTAMCARRGPGEPFSRLRRDLSWERWQPALERDPSLTNESDNPTRGAEGWTATVSSA